MSLADAEKYADDEIAGEGGSNVFYLGKDAQGNGLVMSIYSKEIFTIAEYQQHMMDIFYTVQAAQADMQTIGADASRDKYGVTHVTIDDFKIKRVRSIKDPSTL